MKVGEKVAKKVDGLFFKKGDRGTVIKVQTKNYVQVEINGLKKWLLSKDLMRLEK